MWIYIVVGIVVLLVTLMVVNDKRMVKATFMNNYSGDSEAAARAFQDAMAQPMQPINAAAVVAGFKTYRGNPNLSRGELEAVYRNLRKSGALTEDGTRLRKSPELAERMMAELCTPDMSTLLERVHEAEAETEKVLKENERQLEEFSALSPNDKRWVEWFHSLPERHKRLVEQYSSRGIAVSPENFDQLLEDAKKA